MVYRVYWVCWDRFFCEKFVKHDFVALREHVGSHFSVNIKEYSEVDQPECQNHLSFPNIEAPFF